MAVLTYFQAVGTKTLSNSTDLVFHDLEVKSQRFPKILVSLTLESLVLPRKSVELVDKAL